MKKRLIALNEAQAIFSTRGIGEQVPFNPYDFINGILSIKTANNFIKFLANENTSQLASDVFKLDRMDLNNRGWHSENAKPLFSKGNLLRTIDGFDIDYLDKITELGVYQGRVDAAIKHEEELREWLTLITQKYSTLLDAVKDDNEIYTNYPIPQDKGANIFMLDISFLERLKTGLNTLFELAAVALGDIPPDGMVKKLSGEEVHSSLPISLFIYQGDYFVIDVRGLIGWPYHDTIDDLGFLEEIKHYVSNSPLASLSYKDGGKVLIEYDEETEKESERVRLLCGAVVSAVLSEYSKWLEPSNGFCYSFADNFKPKQREKTPLEKIMDEAVRLVIDERIRLCEVCHAPFVLAYEKGRATSKKKTCSDICRQKKSNSAR